MLHLKKIQQVHQLGDFLLPQSPLKSQGSGTTPIPIPQPQQKSCHQIPSATIANKLGESFHNVAEIPLPDRNDHPTCLSRNSISAIAIAS